MNNNHVNIILANCHKLRREAYTALLNSYNSFRIMAGVRDGEELVKKYFDMQPDIILTNIILSSMNGLEAIQEIRETDSDVKSLVISEFNDWSIIEECISIGVDGFVSVSDELSRLIKAIEVILSGETFFPEYIGNSFSKNRKPVFVSALELRKIKKLFTRREEEVFRLYGRGFTTGEISQMLNLSKKTVEFHEYHIKNKLELRTINKLVHFASINTFIYRDF